MDSSSVIDISSSTTSTRTGLPSGLSSSVRPWGEVVVMVDTLSGSPESTLSLICDFAEKRTGTSQATPGNPTPHPDPALPPPGRYALRPRGLPQPARPHFRAPALLSPSEQSVLKVSRADVEVAYGKG